MKQCENGHFYDELRHTQCPYCVGGTTVGVTTAAAASDLGKTVAIQSSPAQSAEWGKTVGIMKKNIGIDPAVGFVICIGGPHRGTDFRLVAGRNFIGRASNMDVALVDDDTVSRENHALLSYDSKHNSFTLAPGMGRGITYLNDAQVESAVRLSAYDVIEIGKSQLLFLPLCSEKFRWDGE